MKKVLLIIMGSILAAIGCVGIFVPLLPTTPFLLLAAAAYGASCPKLYNKLMRNKYIGAYINNFRQKAGVPKSIKIRSIIFLWITLGITSAIFRTPTVWIVCASVGVAISLHIALLRSTKKAEKLRLSRIAAEELRAAALKEKQPPEVSSGAPRCVITVITQLKK